MPGSNPFRRNAKPAGGESTIPGSPANDRRYGATESRSSPLREQGPIPTPSASITKRVRIASPPVAISPEISVSSAISPEPARSPGSPSSYILSHTQALAADPFQVSSSDGEEEDENSDFLDKPDNTRLSSVQTRKPGNLGEGDLDHSKDALAGAAGAAAALPSSSLTASPMVGYLGHHGRSATQPNRPTMDVDGFTRLLLTGDSGVSSGQSRALPPQSSSPPKITNESSSSIADTSSVSQQSFFEPVTPTILETPRTSNELDREEDEDEERGGGRGGAGMGDQQQLIIQHDHEAYAKQPPTARSLNKRSPNVPRSMLPRSVSPQMGRYPQLTASPPSNQTRVSSPSNLDKPLPPPPIDNVFPLQDDDHAISHRWNVSQKMPPPPPPLSRRRSQHRRSQSHQESDDSISRSVSSAHISTTTSWIRKPARSATTSAPPPPPSRRQKVSSGFELPTAEAETEAAEETNTFRQVESAPGWSMDSVLESVPTLTKKPSASKQLSSVTSHASTRARPPRPPPRRGQSLSHSHFDSQVKASTDGILVGSESGRSSPMEGRGEFEQSAPTDILADLAALQTEVDKLRRQQG